MKRLFKKNTESQVDYSAAIELEAGQTELSPGLRNLYCPQATTKSRVRDIVDILTDEQVIQEDQAAQIRTEQEQSGTEVEKLLAKQGVSDEQILRAKAGLYGFEFKNIIPEQVDRKAFALLEMNYIRTNYLLPIKVKEDGTLLIATTSPSNVFAIDDVKRLTNMNVDVVVCAKADIEAVCEEFDDNKFDYNVDEFMTDMDDVELVQDNEEEVEDLEKSAGESPVIKFVNYFFTL